MDAIAFAALVVSFSSTFLFARRFHAGRAEEVDAAAEDAADIFDEVREGAASTAAGGTIGVDTFTSAFLLLLSVISTSRSAGSSAAATVTASLFGVAPLFFFEFDAADAFDVGESEAEGGEIGESESSATYVLVMRMEGGGEERPAAEEVRDAAATVAGGAVDGAVDVAAAICDAAADES